MKKLITLALVLAAITFAAHAQSTAQKDSKSTTAPAQSEVKDNPLYQPGGNQGVNPLSEGSAKTTGSPIGGIVVKGGHNGLQTTNMPTNPSGASPATPDAQKSTGNPIGGIIVKSDKSISEKGIK